MTAFTKTVSLDFETFSGVDLTKRGAYRYAEDATTGIWCAAFAVDGAEPVLALHPGRWAPEEGQPSASELHALAADPAAQFAAFNAAFERVIWHHIMHRRYGWPDIPLARWRCTMVECAALALPHRLETAAKALGVPHQKDMTGHRLMLRMARPVNPDEVKAGGVPRFNDSPEDLAQLGEYCKQDVRTEQAIAHVVRRLPKFERRVWEVDQKINDRGVQFDVPLARRIYQQYLTSVERTGAALTTLTAGKVASVTGRKDFQEWLASRGFPLNSIAKANLHELLTRELPGDVREAIALRLTGAKTSLAKALAFIKYASPADQRGRGLLQYHGADTGRWAGRGPQPQNLPAHTRRLPPDFAQRWLGTARKLMRAGKTEELSALWEPAEAAALLIRTCITAPEGRKLVWADYSQIEARVVAWLAEEQWLLDAFAEGDKTGKSVVYEAMASRIYDIPADQIGKSSEERQMGKRVVLGAGFGMGARRFRETCALDGVELTEEQAKFIITTYRTANANIQRYWRRVDEAMVEAVQNPGHIVHLPRGVQVLVRDGFLRIVLPARMRALAYYRPQLATRMTPWGAEQPCVTAMRSTGPNKAWIRIELCGTFVTENITQAVARDLMARAMVNIEDAKGLDVVFTVHDEVIAEAPAQDTDAAARMATLLTDRPTWAAGLPIAAEVEEGPWYRK